MLMTISLCMLLALVAKFDLEMLQLNAVNVFMYAKLDETIFMQMRPGFGK